MASLKKLILVVGATGAQGTAIIDALLAPSESGSPSPYTIRALTRDPTSKRARDLISKGVECIKGSIDDLASVTAAFNGCYGAWINTDGFTLGEQKEIYYGVKIFEIAKRTPSMRHFAYSSLDYSMKLGNFDSDYHVAHHDGKAVVAEFLTAQPSAVSSNELSWSVVLSGVYMEMLNHPLLGPSVRREDGTFVFTSPIEDGHMVMVALDDLGFWARYTFDHRAETSGKHLAIASDLITWGDLAATFTKVTGHPAVYERKPIDEWWEGFEGADRPLAVDARKEGTYGSITVRENYAAWWRMWRDDLVRRDMDWVKGVHPNALDLETWMRKTGYTGQVALGVLKIVEEGNSAMT